MLTIWAMAIMLSVHTAAFVDDTLPPTLQNPIPMPSLPSTNNLVLARPLNMVPRGPSIPKGHESREQPAGTTGGKCSAVAKYFVSEQRLKNYTEASMPEKIKQMLLSEEFGLGGIVGSVVGTTLSSLNLKSLLDITSLDLLGSVDVGGVLDKASSNSNSLQLPLVSDVLPLNQEPQGSQPASTAENNALKGLGLGALSLPKLPLPLNNAVDKTGELKESTSGLVNKARVPGVNDAVSGLMDIDNLDKMLVGMKATKVTVGSMNSTTTSDGIHVHTTAVVSIGGEGILGPVISILGFEMNMEVCLTIGISTNDTQCPTLQVQNKDITAKNVSILLAQTLTSSLPTPVPLTDVINQLITAELKNKESKSFDSDFSDFNECKNSTGVFTYQVRISEISEDGLSVFYCADVVLKEKSTPVPGSDLPPNPKNANVSLIFSHNLLRAVVTHVAKLSSVSKDGLHTAITKITYSYQTQNKIQATYSVNIVRSGETIATGKTILTISFKTKISKHKLISDMKLERAEHNVTPSEDLEAVKEIMVETQKKFFSILKDIPSKIYVPGISSQPLIDATVSMSKLALQAAN